MPFIVRWPARVESGSINSDLVSNVDFAPTFLEMAGVEVPSDMQGRSILGMLDGSDPEPVRDTFFYQYYEYPASHCVQRHYGVRSDRYKLIYFYVIDEWELFDLEEDPNELTSVFDDPGYAEVRTELEAELAATPFGIGRTGRQPACRRLQFRRRGLGWLWNGVGGDATTPGSTTTRV